MDLRCFPVSILLKRAERVVDFGEDLKHTVEAMFKTMYETRGVGLAANQVGIDRMIAVANPTGEKKDELTLINPEIIESEGSESLEEGCLSCPGINAQIKRAQRVTVRYQDTAGEFHDLQAEDILARIIQHELDHLNGKVIIDRMSATAKILHKQQINALKQSPGKEE